MMYDVGENYLLTSFSSNSAVQADTSVHAVDLTQFKYRLGFTTIVTPQVTQLSYFSLRTPTSPTAFFLALLPSFPPPSLSSTTSITPTPSLVSKPARILVFSSITSFKTSCSVLTPAGRWCPHWWWQDGWQDGHHCGGSTILLSRPVLLPLTKLLKCSQMSSLGQSQPLFGPLPETAWPPESFHAVIQSHLRS